MNSNAAANQSTGINVDRTLLERGSTRTREEKDEPLTVADDMAIRDWVNGGSSCFPLSQILRHLFRFLRNLNISIYKYMNYVIKYLNDLIRFVVGGERSFVNNEGFFDIVNRTLLDQL